MALRACIVAAALVFVHPDAGLAETPPPENRCEGRGTAVVVRTAAHRMLLCEGGQIHNAYLVSLGGGGVDKRKQGDRRTPLGTYFLSPPRPSRHYKTFIHVGYPTKAQRARGFTGSRIGVHGPTRGAAALQRTSGAALFDGLTVLVDWTDGCIAVDSDAEIDAISRWVTAHGVRRIVIE